MSISGHKYFIFSGFGHRPSDGWLMIASFKSENSQKLIRGIYLTFVDITGARIYLDTFLGESRAHIRISLHPELRKIIFEFLDCVTKFPHYSKFPQTKVKFYPVGGAN